MGCELNERNKQAFAAFMHSQGIDKREAIIRLIEKSVPSCFGEGESFCECLKCDIYEFCKKVKTPPRVPCVDCTYYGNRTKNVCGTGVCGDSKCQSKNGWNRFIDRNR